MCLFGLQINKKSSNSQEELFLVVDYMIALGMRWSGFSYLHLICMKIGAKLIVPGLIVLLIVCWILLRTFKVFDFYRIPSPSMEPTLPVGCQIISYKSSDHKVYQIVSFENNKLEKPEIYCSRIAGLEGDTVEIKDGYLWVNGVLMDKKGALQFSYELTDTMVESNFMAIEALDKMYRIAQNRENEIINLSEAELKNWNNLSKAKKFDLPVYQSVFENSDFTILNFGPVVVPEGQCFMLGDNRNNSLDSRYFGFISVHDVIGPVFKITN